MKTMIFLVISVIIFIGFAVLMQNILVSSAADLAASGPLESAVKNDNWESAGTGRKPHPGMERKQGHWQILINHEEVDNIDSTLIG